MSYQYMPAALLPLEGHHAVVVRRIFSLKKRKGLFVCDADHTTAISDAGSAWRATFLYMKVGALVSLCAPGVSSLGQT